MADVAQGCFAGTGGALKRVFSTRFLAKRAASPGIYCTCCYQINSVLRLCAGVAARSRAQVAPALVGPARRSRVPGCHEGWHGALPKGQVVTARRLAAPRRSACHDAITPRGCPRAPARWHASAAHARYAGASGRPRPFPRGPHTPCRGRAPCCAAMRSAGCRRHAPMPTTA